jgi:hypothetical protein
MVAPPRLPCDQRSRSRIWLTLTTNSTPVFKLCFRSSQPFVGVSDHGASSAADHRRPPSYAPCCCRCSCRRADSGPADFYQGESRVLDSPEGVCAGEARSEYPATSVPFSNSSPPVQTGPSRSISPGQRLVPVRHRPS